jgi:hypothetical protein
MVEPIVHRVPRDPRLRGDGPSFLMVVVMSGVVLAIFFLVALFVLHASGRELLPGVKQTSHPHAMLRVSDLPEFRV